MVGVAKLTALGGAIATQGDRRSVPGLGSGPLVNYRLPGPASVDEAYRAGLQLQVSQIMEIARLIRHGCCDHRWCVW